MQVHGSVFKRHGKIEWEVRNVEPFVSYNESAVVKSGTATSYPKAAFDMTVAMEELEGLVAVKSAEVIDSKAVNSKVTVNMGAGGRKVRAA